MSKYSRIYRAMCSMPWMIQPEKLEAIAEFIEFQMEGGKLSSEQLDGVTSHPKRDASRDVRYYAVEGSSARVAKAPNQQSGIAVIPMYGVVEHRSMDFSSGGNLSIQRFKQQFRDAVDNYAVSAIVLDVDSPGGSVDGVEEMAAEIFDARKEKKIVAVANTLAASAAYYLASSADELIVTPSGEVGSIGVYMLHSDYSALYEKNGIKNTLIKAGKYKAQGNPWMPLDETSMTALQDSVNAHYEMFTKAVARNRGVSVEDVQGGFGEGRTVMAKQAVKLGMADKVATLDETIKRLGAKPRESTNALASDEDRTETDDEVIQRTRRLRIKQRQLSN